MNFKSEILVEVFQSITNLNLSKEPFPNVVVPCASCGMYKLYYFKGSFMLYLIVISVILHFIVIKHA